MLLLIDLKDGMPKDPTKDFSFEDIESCFIKFKKYDLETFEVLGQMTKNVKIKDIDENFLVDLKIELDDTFSDDDEKLGIETE
jgi:preprotein translocase subunit Sec63